MRKSITIIFTLCFFAANSHAQQGWFKIDNPIKGRITSIDFLSANDGFVLGDTELYRTNDGGNSWKRITLPSPNGKNGTFHFSTILTGVLTFFDNNVVKVFSTANGGDTWAEKNIPDVTENDGFNSFSFNNVANGYILGATQVGFNPLIAHTIDSGQTWDSWHVLLPDGGPNYVIIKSLSFRTPAIGLGSFEYLFPAYYYIMSTIDSGKHWTEIKIGECASFLTSNEWICDSSDNYTTSFFKSTNDGIDWDLVSSIDGNVYGTTFNGQTGYALTEISDPPFVIPGIYSSSDYGNNWTRDSIPPSLDHFYFYLSATDSKVAYAASDSLIIKTISAGQSSVKIGSFIDSFNLLSNPTNSSADFQFSALQEPTGFELFDALGRSLLRRELPAGQASLHVDMQAFPAGMYFARLGGETVRVLKF